MQLCKYFFPVLRSTINSICACYTKKSNNLTPFDFFPFPEIFSGGSKRPQNPKLRAKYLQQSFCKNSNKIIKKLLKQPFATSQIEGFEICTNIFK